MGIMPVAVYDGVDVGGVDAFSNQIPQNGVLTHGHLAENNNHGGGPDGPAGPEGAAERRRPHDPIGIEGYEYEQGDLSASGSGANPPRVQVGHSLTFLNHDAAPAREHLPHDHRLQGAVQPFDRASPTRSPDGPRTLRLGPARLQLRRLQRPGRRAATHGRRRRTSPPGNYSYFCRVHPFMRGSFRVVGGG